MQTVSMPWKAWHGEEECELFFPAAWDLQCYPMEGAPSLSEGEIYRSLSQAIGSPPIDRIARGAKDVAIAVDDITRPTPMEKLLPLVLEHIKGAGVKKGSITIVVALGSHTPLSETELCQKLGRKIVSDYTIIQHDPLKNLSEVGIGLDGVPVRINSDFLKADMKITMGGITPHPFAGFSGGGKMVLPGLASMEIIERTHRFVAMGFRGGLGVIEGNRFREDVEKVCRKCEVDLMIDVVLNQNREIAGVFAGDFVAAFLKGVNFARNVYRTKLPETVDVVLLNAYPKDTDLVQSENAFNLLRSAKRPFIKEDGTVILMAASSNGVGSHGLFSPGGRLYRKPLR